MKIYVLSVSNKITNFEIHVVLQYIPFTSGVDRKEIIFKLPFSFNEA